MNDQPRSEDPGDDDIQVVASLEHLTGPARGAVIWIGGSAADVTLAAPRLVKVTSAAADADRVVARLHRAGDTYEIEAREGRSLWVNRKQVSARRLEHGDTIEFGVDGPLSRYRLLGGLRRPRASVGEICSDCLAYVRTSRKPLGRRLLQAASDVVRRLAVDTSVAFRIFVVLAIAALFAVSWQQYRVSVRLEENIAAERMRLESVAAALSQAREEALRPGDLAALREELSTRVVSNVERLEALERRSEASARVIAASAASVAFLQGAYGMRETETGRMLRHVVDADGVPVMTPFGRPLLSLEGDGPVAEVQFTGTGFLLGEPAVLVTNRHVARPWERMAGPETALPEGLEPAMVKFVAYFPDADEAVPVEIRLVSETADLATLALAAPGEVAGLRLAEAPPSPGDEILVMGYPTGLRSMLAQSGAAFIEELQASAETNFWTVAERLAARGLIAPLASRGIVGQATAATVVYDAETTHGGSGGPVLNARGEVVAVNTAILPEFGGSNLGVPAARVRELLELGSGG